MKKKELQQLAKKIAKAEQIVQSSSDKKEINEAKQLIMDLTNKAANDSFENLLILDELIQEALQSS